MNDRNEEAIKIAEDIIESIHVNPNSFTNVRKYFGLVYTLDEKSEIKWVNRELYGFRKLEEIPSYRKIKISQVKDRFAFVQYSYADLEKYKKHNIEIALKLLPEDRYCNNPFQNSITANYLDWSKILDNVDSIIYQKTYRFLSQLKFEKTNSDIFDETRKTVDKKLSSLCPKALGKFTEIYADAIDSNSELDIKQVALGCRDVLKDFADAIYPANPATNEKYKFSDGKEHSLTEDKYMNRIIAFILKNTDSDTNKEFMQSYVQYLFNFLENVNKLANKGTHKGISKEQANRCVILDSACKSID